MLSLVLILNLLSELDFFKDIEVGSFFPAYLALLNSGSLIFEMFPFICLVCTQFFFIGFFKDDQLNIFKYSGLKNTSIIKILSLLTFLIGVFVIIFFYNFTSNLKNFYLELKSNYTSDDKYLAVITNNGLWIKDKIENRILIINSTKIKPDHLIDTFISEFDSDFNIIRNIKSDKVNIKNFTEKNFNKIFYFNGKQAVCDIINFKLFTSSKIEKKLIKLMETYQDKVIPTMPVGANLLMNKYDIPEGKTLGSKLKMIEEIWVGNNFNISDKQVEKIAKS